MTADGNQLGQLVQQLYLPGSPQNVSSLENVLQRMQRSPQGWRLAEALLQSGDSQVRFFGALTFMIKIKLDWQVVPCYWGIRESDVRTGKPWEAKMFPFFSIDYCSGSCDLSTRPRGLLSSERCVPPLSHTSFDLLFLGSIASDIFCAVSEQAALWLSKVCPRTHPRMSLCAS